MYCPPLYDHEAVFAHDPPPVGGEDRDTAQRQVLVRFMSGLEDVVDIVEPHEEVAEPVRVWVPVGGEVI